MLEEPENHLTYSKLNRLLNDIVQANKDKQIFVTTHSSFVANKLGINNLFLLEKEKVMSWEAKDFFRFIRDYDSCIEEYEKCAEFSLEVSRVMEEIRKQNGIEYKSKEISFDEKH